MTLLSTPTVARRTAAAATLALALALAACGADDSAAPETSPSASTEATAEQPGGDEETAEPEAVTIDVTVSADGVEPRGERVEVAVGQPVTLRIDSEVDDEIHVHSDPEHGLDVAAGAKGEELTFTVDRPGQVAVESHHHHATIVQLVVRDDA